MKANALLAAVPEPLTTDYRRLCDSNDLIRFRIKVEHTDLLIAAEQELVDEALALVHTLRAEIKAYISDHPKFYSSLVPLQMPTTAAPIIQSMAAAAAQAGVGPMAAVAGAIAEYVGRGLLALSPEIIVENGGDIFCCSRKQRTFMLLAEQSAFGAVRISFDNEDQSFGVCTSAGTSGHSLSFGAADAVMVMAADTALADATATALANRVQNIDDLQPCVDAAHTMGALGAVAIMGDRLAACGAVELQA